MRQLLRKLLLCFGLQAWKLWVRTSADCLSSASAWKRLLVDLHSCSHLQSRSCRAVQPQAFTSRMCAKMSYAFPLVACQSDNNIKDPKEKGH